MYENVCKLQAPSQAWKKQQRAAQKAFHNALCPAAPPGAALELGQAALPGWKALAKPFSSPKAASSTQDRQIGLGVTGNPWAIPASRGRQGQDISCQTGMAQGSGVSRCWQTSRRPLRADGRGQVFKRKPVLRDTGAGSCARPDFGSSPPATSAQDGQGAWLQAGLGTAPLLPEHPSAVAPSPESDAAGPYISRTHTHTHTRSPELRSRVRPAWRPSGLHWATLRAVDSGRWGPRAGAGCSPDDAPG